LQFVLDESNLSKEALGKIDIRDMNTWIECDSASASQMIKSLDGKRYNNRTVRMNEADGGFKRPSDERGGDERRGTREVGSAAPRERKRTFGGGSSRDRR
jgi:DbpA RNA binding domain